MLSFVICVREAAVQIAESGVCRDIFHQSRVTYVDLSKKDTTFLANKTTGQIWGAVTVCLSKYLPWQAMRFLQRSTHFSKTELRSF